MTRLDFEHLTGARKGQTDYVERFPASIGSGPDADVVVPGTAPLHARILRDGDRILLQDASSGYDTLIAGEAVHEIALHEGDIIQFGYGGPRVRYRREGALRASLPHVGQHRDFRIALYILLLAGALLAGWTYTLNRQVTMLETALQAAEAERQSFQERIERERARAEASQYTLERRIEEFRRREEDLTQRLSQAAAGTEVRQLREQLLESRTRLAALEAERAAAERIISQYGAGVCLIQGSYAFYDSKGRPLRYRVDKDGKRLRESDGSLGVEVDGNGPVHTVSTVGTGFLVDKNGMVVTNRHVAEPWWKDDTAQTLAKDGYEPRFVQFRVFFPNVAEGLKAELHRKSESVDLAILKVDIGRWSIPVLPLDVSPQGAVPGQPVVVVGYPTGLEAIMAKSDSSIVEDIVSKQGTNTERLADALSRKGLIRPSTTQGHIGDVTKTDIVFDAATTQGGSGGPVFNRKGRVIAVEYAVLSKFGGNSYGLPARYALELLKQPRT